MGAALRIMDIVAEAHDVFMEFIGILEGAFYGNPLCLAFKIDHVADCILGTAHSLYEAYNAFGFVKDLRICYFASAVFKFDSKLGI